MDLVWWTEQMRKENENGQGQSLVSDAEARYNTHSRRA